ncbi:MULTISPECIES: hypothetical protein [Deefgea]|uniref:Tetratricopeptide repeat protein n=1 Tax=Deefgea chitinilytica TaxID=570276 RepID=A0ABS2CD14_9NEIS|nr:MULTISPECIES: hypothetical protein [Deefgea]MBM5572039.1 tetratricopeptide repeat protein [Deefgea chitinilytica]MBM9889274.1 tetratricopeptide repeat protein [Deefgea sp. CFH1-16]
MNTSELKAAAHAAWDDDDEALAEQHFLAALAIDEQDAVTNYDLALLYKYQSRWVESLRYNRRAAELNPEDEAAWWNLGIAATALSDWATAALAWEFFGVTLDASTGLAPDLKLGSIPVRITQGDQVEVLWANRLDPARAQIVSVPMPDCGVRYHDIVLIDGAPRGTRELNGQQVPVFDWLEFWQRSNYSTYVLEANIPDELAVHTLDKLIKNLELAVEDWASNLRLLCKACSEGTPHEQHDQKGDVVSEWQPERQMGFAALNDQALADVLDAWQAAHPEIEILEVYNALDVDEAAEGDAK